MSCDVCSVCCDFRKHCRKMNYEPGYSKMRELVTNIYNKIKYVQMIIEWKYEFDYVPYFYTSDKMFKVIIRDGCFC